MELREKLELQKEITNEVREDITRYVGSRITSRILYALSIVAIELCFWGAIIAVAAKEMTVSAGVHISFMLFVLRIVQMLHIKWFNEK